MCVSHTQLDTPVFQCGVSLNNWEEPGDEATNRG